MGFVFRVYLDVVVWLVGGWGWLLIRGDFGGLVDVVDGCLMLIILCVFVCFLY